MEVETGRYRGRYAQAGRSGRKGQQVIATGPRIAAAPDARGGGKVGHLATEG